LRAAVHKYVLAVASDNVVELHELFDVISGQYVTTAAVSFSVTDPDTGSPVAGLANIAMPSDAGHAC
jgi:hypothetical protein